MKVIKRANLVNWLQNTLKTQVLIAPKDTNGVLLYQPVKHVKEIVWDYVRPALSSKEFFFPATECLFTIEVNGQNIRLTETVPEQKQVIFGIRSCDARGLVALDTLFIKTEPVDLNYAKRRGNTIVIGMACDQMGDACFCTKTGGAPDDPSGMDILLKHVDGGYTVTALTERGQEIVRQEWSTEENNHRLPPVASAIPATTPSIPSLDAWPPLFDDEYWAIIADRCLSCRICAYVCPTCRCFDVRDEPVDTSNGSQVFERLRCWDSCARDDYRKIAGGHNPRSQSGQRLRNRFFCKFYYFPEKYGAIACTGCGRCIDSCPVNIDITEILDHVTSAIKQPP